MADDLRTRACVCWPDTGCEQGYGDDDSDPRNCVYCVNLDGEWPCPADLVWEEYDRG